MSRFHGNRLLVSMVALATDGDDGSPSIWGFRYQDPSLVTLIVALVTLIGALVTLIVAMVTLIGVLVSLIVALVTLIVALVTLLRVNLV